MYPSIFIVDLHGFDSWKCKDFSASPRNAIAALKKYILIFKSTITHLALVQ